MRAPSFHSQPREFIPWILPWEELKFVSLLLGWVFNHCHLETLGGVCVSLHTEDKLVSPENVCTSLAINLWALSSLRHDSDAIHGFIFP